MLKDKALKVLEDQLAQATKKKFESMFPGDKEAAEVLQKQLDQLAEVQKTVIAKHINFILGAIHEKLQSRQLFASNEMALELATSTDEPSESVLKLFRLVTPPSTEK